MTFITRTQANNSILHFGKALSRDLFGGNPANREDVRLPAWIDPACLDTLSCHTSRSQVMLMEDFRELQKKNAAAMSELEGRRKDLAEKLDDANEAIETLEALTKCLLKRSRALEDQVLSLNGKVALPDDATLVALSGIPLAQVLHPIFHILHIPSFICPPVSELRIPRSCPMGSDCRSFPAECSASISRCCHSGGECVRGRWAAE